jgi:phosphatidylethanolamine-binding protein (PEBP) family uncharacterized protein
METDAFEDGGIVPERYAGGGESVQPGFTFSNIPGGTASFAIFFHDLHIAFDGAVSGTAGIGRGNYFGPGAPAGPRYHHYVFELYTLSAIIVGKAAYVGRFRQ